MNRLSANLIAVHTCYIHILNNRKNIPNFALIENEEKLVLYKKNLRLFDAIFFNRMNNFEAFVLNLCVQIGTDCQKN